jgi:myo-inositol-1(or 4)-monophosphatase
LKEFRKLSSLTTMDVKQLEEIKDFLVGVAHEAGDMIVSAHPSTGSSGSKKNCK